MRRLSLTLLCTLGYALALCSGCGGDEDPRPDGGTPYVPPIPDAGQPDAGTGGPVDLIPPSLTSTTPANNAIAVPPESNISVSFSEAMRTDRGVLQITPNNLILQGKPENWDAARRTATFTIAGGLPLTKKLTVNLVDFADLAGNPLPTPANFTFTVSDGKPPRVTASTPAEGAASVALSTNVATFTFNEPMDTTAGTLTAGGGLSIGTPSWASDKLQLSVPISGLVNPGNYSIRLQGFRNLIGKALDETTYLGDGKLDFGTGPDVTPPTVTDASPAEGATEVPADSTSLLVVSFNEPMGTVGTATLVNVPTNARTTLTPQWAPDGFSVTYDVLDRLSPGVAMRVEFVGLKDRAGNTLSPTPYLNDGKLDFSTAIDRTRPAIIASDPVEGTTNVYPNEVYVKAGSPATTGLRKVVTLEFNEPMDTTITSASLYSPTNSSIPPRTLTGVWAANRRTLTFTILPPPTGGPPLEPLRSYALDLKNHKDPSGNTLDAAHPLLGDGELDFSTSADDPTLNAACEDMLLKTVTPVTATATATASTPRVDVLRQRYELTLPGSGSQFQGFTRFQPGANALYSTFFSKSTLTVVTNPANGDFIDVTQGAAPAACPGHIVYRVDFSGSSLPELRMRFGPTADQKFVLVTQGTL